MIKHSTLKDRCVGQLPVGIGPIQQTRLGILPLTSTYFHPTNGKMKVVCSIQAQLKLTKLLECQCISTTRIAKETF